MRCWRRPTEPRRLWLFQGECDVMRVWFV
jgi:hypothetical protein